MSIKTVELLILARNALESHSNSAYCQAFDEYELLKEIDNNENVKRHLNTIKNLKRKKEAEELKKLHCPICKRLLKTEQGVKQHVKDYHKELAKE